MSIASSIDEFDFTEDEIREQLEKLGYKNVPSTRLKEFKRGTIWTIFNLINSRLSFYSRV